MKYLVILLVIGFLVEEGLCRIEKDHNDNHHHGKLKSKVIRHSKQERSKSLRERVKEEIATTGKPSNNVQVSEFKVSHNESLYLNYNESASFYGIWSYNKHTSLLYANEDKLVGVYNTSSNSLLTLNLSNNQVAIKTNVTIEFTKDNLSASFSRMYDLMLTGKGDNLSVSVSAFFNAVLKADSENHCENCDFIKCLSSSFGNYVQELRDNIINAAEQFGSGIAIGIDGIRDSLEAIIGNVTKGIGEVGGNVTKGIGEVGGNVTKGIGGNVVAGIRGGFNIFGALFTPFFSGARNVAAVFARFFGAAIENAVNLPRLAFRIFSTAIGRGSEFINFNLTSQLNTAIRSAGTFFNNVTDAIYQIFVGSGISYFGSNVINDGQQDVPISSIITGDNNWLIRIGGKANLKMTINYNSKYNLFAFYNRELNVSTVFNGNTGFYSVYNTTSGVGLIISQLTGNARLAVDKTGQIQQAFKQNRNFTLGFILIGKTIENQSGGLNNIVNLDSTVFNIRTLIFLLKSGMNIDLAFINKSNILNTIKINFNVLFNAAQEYFKANDSDFNLSLGPLNILLPVMGFQTIITNFMPIITDIFTRLGGMFNPRLILSVAGSFAEHLRTGIGKFIFGSINFALQSIKNISDGIDSAIKGVLGGLPKTEIDVDSRNGHSTPIPNTGTKKNCTCGDV